MPIPRIRVLPDAGQVARAAADRIVEAATAAIDLAGRFSLGLSGGSTPKPLYELLAEPPFARAIDWAKVHIYFCDERCVPPSHKDSNFRFASDALLDSVPLPPANIHRMRGEADPEQAAADYGRLLKEHFGDEGGLDVAVLGMGEDGHTASLFPETAALAETHHRCVANFVPKLNAWRLTLTAPFLNRTRDALLLVTGANKAPAVQEVLEGSADSQRYPIKLIAPPEGQVLWLMDSAAAGMG